MRLLRSRGDHFGREVGEGTVDMPSPLKRPSWSRSRIEVVRELMHDLSENFPEGPCVVVHREGDAKNVWSLGSSMIVGRDTTCDLVLEDDCVSGRHCRIRKSVDTWFVEDLNSTNGIYLDGCRTDRTILKAGDVVQLGASTLTFFGL